MIGIDPSSTIAPPVRSDVPASGATQANPQSSQSTPLVAVNTAQLGAPSLAHSPTALTIPSPISGIDQGDYNRVMAAIRTSEQVDLAAVLSLLFKMANSMKQISRESRMSYTALQIAKLKEAAEDGRQAGIMGMAASCASGAAAIASGGMSAAKTAKAGKMEVKNTQAMSKLKTDFNTTNKSNTDLKAGKFTPKQQQQLMNLEQKQTIAMQKVLSQGNAQAQIMQGVGEIGKGSFELGASEMRGQQADTEAEARHDASMSELETEYQNLMKDMLQQISSKLAAIQDAEHETNKAIVRA